ncbi:DNA sulfur modification protein DndD [Parabacteroides sp. PFB2-10]|uniref:AAA family ATPase n=1 Tax=Parabacteroides sp. PFB2-10 TaxID=1742405 RepID=UPI0024745A07|nr:AAA family ATPase [Parabacteroides sp. PFB2-10]MDH6313000.1 DNA sulfur modification protein DndD [Parabacteroides sp. PFB2-10]
MRIKTIELNNYRLYNGINKVVFPNGNNKNLYLISGENGFGKTTFLHSLLWCLYGRLMADIDETFRKEMSNGGYNNSIFNNLSQICRQKLQTEVTQSTLECIKKKGYSVDTEFIKKWSCYAVSLEFADVFIPSIPCHSLKITRSYDILLDEEKVEILIDNKPNELTVGIGNEIFINDFILNKDIARFFFFDSEKIVSLAETNTVEEKRKLCSAYNEVLGVKKYEELKKNLENMRLRFRRKSTDIESRNQLSELLTRQKKISIITTEQEQQTVNLDNQLLLLKKADENLQMQLLREGSGITIDELNRQRALLETTQKKDADYKQQLKQFLEYAPFAISGKLLKQTKEQLECDFNILRSQNDVRNQNFLLGNINVEMQQAFNNIPISAENKKKLVDSFNNIVSKYQNQATNEIPLLSVNKEYLDEFLSVYSNITTTYKIEFEHLADDYRKNKQVMERTARNISNMHGKENDNVIKSIRKQKNESERKILELERHIRQLHEERGAANKELAVVNRQVLELSKKVSVDDSDSKKDKVAEQLISELNTFLVSLKTEKKTSLERRIKTTMNNLMHKIDFIGEVDVVIVDDMIDINLYASDGNMIKKEMLSKGEQQLYATSLLKALVEESNIQFPVFIDSPLQKFDKSHANKIITEFYPTVSKQVVLFPLLHKELTEIELETMKPYVNSAYLLKNENSYSYIQQVDINDLMKE